MRRSILAVATVAALAAGVAPATAAATCPMLVSPTGGPLPVGSFPQADIKSGDIASGRKTVAAVLRLASLTGTDVVTAAGVQYEMSWTIGGSAYVIRLARSATRQDTSMSVDGTAMPPPFVRVDPVTGEIRWLVLRANVPTLAKPRQVFRAISAQTSGPAGTYDAAATKRTYVDGSPGCIPAG
jgi:hypothetical protein